MTPAQEPSEALDAFIDRLQHHARVDGAGAAEVDADTAWVAHELHSLAADTPVRQSLVQDLQEELERRLAEEAPRSSPTSVLVVDDVVPPFHTQPIALSDCALGPALQRSRGPVEHHHWSALASWTNGMEEILVLRLPGPASRALGHHCFAWELCSLCACAGITCPERHHSGTQPATGRPGRRALELCPAGINDVALCHWELSVLGTDVFHRRKLRIGGTILSMID